MTLFTPDPGLISKSPRQQVQYLYAPAILQSASKVRSHISSWVDCVKLCTNIPINAEAFDSHPKSLSVQKQFTCSQYPTMIRRRSARLLI
jgi:hypothetical protein